MLVTGDPPADSHRLCEALRKSVEARHTVIGIPCGPELKSGGVFRAGSVIAPLPSGGAAVTEGLEPAPLLFVFDDVGQLSDAQVAEICEAPQNGARRATAGVLLARPGFLTRLEEPPLRSLRGALAQFSFDEIGRDEAIEFLRHQLAVRHLREEGRGIRLGGRRILAASGVLLTMGIGGFLLLHQGNILGKSPSGVSATSSPEREASAPRSTASQPTSAASDKAAPTEMPAPIAPVAAPPDTARPPEPVAPPVSPPAAQGPDAPPGGRAVSGLSPAARTPQDGASDTARSSTGRETSAGVASSPAHSPPGNESGSLAEIASLVTRGDDFLKAGDIASARLFYERAAEMGGGAAALRLGATFDPGVLSRAGIRGTPADPAQAMSWYRRARELGEAAAAERLKRLDQQPRVEPGPPIR